MIEYGLISNVDARCLENTIDLILADFPSQEIHITEVGVNEWRTAKGIMEYVKSKGRFPVYTGIDNLRDFNNNHYEALSDPDVTFIQGNSNEVYWRLEDNSQHLIFIDGCHAFASVIADFFCYASKVRIDGYLAFHDTGKQIKPFTDFQSGDKENPDAYISVRKALEKMGLFGIDYSGYFKDNQPLFSFPNGGIKKMYSFPNWKLIFDEADETNPAGGICIFKKLY